MSDDLQNVYDDPEFFAGYSQLERFGSNWGRAMEHGDFLSLLPKVAGLRALDLGCGGGQLTYQLAEMGARQVIGVDLSERMLEIARERRSHPNVLYVRGSIEEADFGEDRFDLVVSSLAFHYVEDYAGLIRRIAGWLSAGGSLVFSTEHPIFTSRTVGGGWTEDMAWKIDRYSVEGFREHHWFVDVRRYHRTLATLVNGLIDAGLTIERIIEPTPNEDLLRRIPEEAAEEVLRPMFILLSARKGSRP